METCGGAGTAGTRTSALLRADSREKGEGGGFVVARSSLCRRTNARFSVEGLKQAIRRAKCGSIICASGPCRDNAQRLGLEPQMLNAVAEILITASYRLRFTSAVTEKTMQREEGWRRGCVN